MTRRETMLERGKWYRYPTGGFLVVERVNFSAAEVRIYSGRVIRESFESRYGEVAFTRREVKKTAISSGCALTQASSEEVAEFTREMGR